MSGGALRWRTGTLGALALALVAGSASASASTLFVLVSDAATLPDVERMEGELAVPLEVLDMDALERITARLAAPLGFVEELEEAGVRAREAEINDFASRGAEAEKGAIKEGYRDAMVAGEINARYKVGALPAVIEITGDGRYRMARRPTSVAAAVAEIERSTYLAAPPALGRARAADRAAAAEPPGSVFPDRAPTSRGAYGGDTTYSVLQAVLDGTSPESFDCIDLRISGVCLYLVTRVYCSLLGCSVEVSPEASIELSHFNPDLLMASYKRLGASTIEESRLLFGGIQNELTGAAIPLLTGVDLPRDYDNPDLWAAFSSEGAAEESKKTMKYHEVDAIGHPGTLLSYIDASGGNPLEGFVSSLSGVPGNIISGLTGAVGQVGNELSQSSASVEGITASIGPAEVYDDPPEGSRVGVLRRPSGDELFAMANRILPTPLADAGAALSDASDTFTTMADAWEMESALDVDSIVTGLETELGASVEPFTEVVEAVGAMRDTIDSISGVPGLGAGKIDLFSFCPSGAEFMKPYFLSGLDFLQWRFNIPEIVFPETYALPLPYNNRIFIGDLSFRGPAGVQWPSSWGPIYPRMGYVQSPDELKAAAVAAARAAHVTTRTGQLHVYTPVPLSSKKYLDITHPPPYDPSDPSSGKWQMVAPELDDRCYAFGESDSPFKGVGGQLAAWRSPSEADRSGGAPWTFDRKSEDGNYGFTLWREYVCCPTPKKAGAVTMNVTDLGRIDLTIEILN